MAELGTRLVGNQAATCCAVGALFACNTQWETFDSFQSCATSTHCFAPIAQGPTDSPRNLAACSGPPGSSNCNTGPAGDEFVAASVEAMLTSANTKLALFLCGGRATPNLKSEPLVNHS